VTRVVVIDHQTSYAVALSGPLLAAGHEVMAVAPPLDFEGILEFRPQVIVLALGRRQEAFGRPIQGYEDILGYQALVEMESYPAISILPIALIGRCLLEREIPLKLNYDLFLVFPEDLGLYQTKVEELATKVKTRRKVSRYLCPACRSRLTYSDKQADLLCLRCGTAVAIIDEESITYLGPDGIHRSGTVDLLK
jgi:hypothetical protein